MLAIARTGHGFATWVPGIGDDTGRSESAQLKYLRVDPGGSPRYLAKLTRAPPADIH